jgi:predicted ATPase
VANLERKSPEKQKAWVEHLRTALPDLSGVTSIERPDERSRYLCLIYRDGLKVPSWMTSEGTLRLLALTLPAFIDDFRGIYLVEEPENGIHPLAIETMYQALSWVKTGQVLLATHSPVLLAVARADDVLCFTRDEETGTKVILGSEHPRLRDWKGETDLGTLFASGVLG